MNNKSTFEYNFDLFDIIRFLLKKKIPILIVTFTGAIVSVIISFLITPMYKSSVILFPATTGSLSQSILTDNPYKEDILKFGEEEDAEQLLQILYSDYIKNRIIQKYNLFTHYEIDKNSKYPNSSINQIYDKNIKFSKTEYQSIEISVLDKNSVIAANIANDISALIDSVYYLMKHERALEALKIAEIEYKKQQQYINLLEDSLIKLRTLGVFDYETEVKTYSEAITKQSANNQVISAKFEALKNYGGKYSTIKEIINEEKDQLVSLRERVAEAQVNAENTFSHKFIVNKATPAEKKSYPVRWLIVSLSTIGTFMFALVMLLFIDFWKRFKETL